MKKVWQIVSIIVAIALSLGMTVFAEGEAALKLSAGSAEVLVGEGTSLVEIPLEFEGEVKLTALQIQVDFSNEIVFKDYRAGDALEGVTAPALGKNPIVIPFVDINAQGVEARTGTLATLVLEVPTDKAKNFAVVVTVEAASDEKREHITETFKTVNGLISVKNASDFELDEARIAASEERKQDVIALKLNAAIAYVNNKVSAIDPDNSKVVPYLKNDRTLVPLRFVSETLGAEVQWEDGWDYCYVIKGDKKIKITFNSADIETNGQVVTYDAPVEVVENRTMVPIRFISEELGYDVKWNQANQVVLITPADNPWKEDGLAELDALESILVTFFFNGVF